MDITITTTLRANIYLKSNTTASCLITQFTVIDMYSENYQTEQYKYRLLSLNSVVTWNRYSTPNLQFVDKQIVAYKWQRTENRALHKSVSSKHLSV